MPLAALSGTTVALLAAVIVAQVVLLAISLVDLVRRPSAAVAFGTKITWYVIVIVFEVVGPIIYLAAGRTEVPRGDGEDRGGQPPAAERAQRTADVLYGPDRHE